MKTLEFANNTHQVDALQVTVRRGTKWSDLYPGEVVALSDVGGANRRGANIVFVHKTRMRDIPQVFLDCEHDPSCHTPEGIAAEMNRVYKDTVSEDEIVTVVGYRPF
jgi:hypothetical protein